LVRATFSNALSPHKPERPSVQLLIAGGRNGA